MVIQQYEHHGSAGLGLHIRMIAGECAFHSCLTYLIAHLAPTDSELAAPYIALTLTVSCSAGPQWPIRTSLCVRPPQPR